ncbi:MAG: hypothetical protein IPJ26_13525 [Bacteroidetes bacterium]|nr:hypothetical protein [Bacteroidota bacterium]
MISIHRSKGLEFPIVIIPFLDWEYTPNNKSILWVKSKEEKFAEHGSIPVQAVKSLSESYFSEDYYEESLNTALDNINLLYVAFTRPEEKLFILSPKKPAHNEIACLLKDAMSTHVEWSQQITNPEIETFTIGQNESKQIQDSKVKSASIYSPASFSMIDFSKSENVQLHLPPLKTSFTSDEIIIGNLIHETISYVYHKDDIPKIVNEVLSKNGNQAFRKFSETVTQQVYAIWTLLENKNWTSSSFEIVNECDLCDEQGMLHRPDRVLINGDTGIVIDFKTGKQDEKYHQQVKEYCRLLEATGISNLTGYLLYTTDKEIVKVV